MTERLTPARSSATPCGSDLLHDLVTRIAAGDKAAFRCLYAFSATPVWRDAVRMLPRPADARAVTRSTFVEIWHLAGQHLDDGGPGVRIWIKAITARRIGDRLRAPDVPCRLPDDHDCHTRRELVALLGAGQATVRTGQTTFASVDNLGRTP